jgi:peptide/nickel transport system ATP-binding protein/oligopeptide transport system ATP-binding protein
MTDTAKPPLLEVKRLKVDFQTETGLVHAVDGVDFAVEQEKTLGVVGESGCGKSVSALAVLGLIQSPPGKIVSGEILYRRNGGIVDLAALDPKGSEMRSIRGKEIAMVFQEPMTALNPVFTVGDQIMEAIRVHEPLSRAETRARATEMLRNVGISNPELRLSDYPHQLSGGMRQRAMIAMAMCCNPRLLIADEPTTALDVTIQAQVLDLMNELRSKLRSALMFITHDLGVIAHMADSVIVMYFGKIVESASVDDIFFDPRHPYTQGLLRSIASISTSKRERLIPIRGMVPNPFEEIRGCGFEPRCPEAEDRCRREAPSLSEIGPGHRVSCWRAEGA